MSKLRTAWGNTDKNQTAIVAALRSVGCSVVSLHKAGGGIPDLLIGSRGKNELMEIKAEGGKLRDSQLDFHARWRGKEILVAYTIDQALRLLKLV